MIVEISQNKANQKSSSDNQIKRAILFIDQLKQIPAKYNQQQKTQFLSQLQQLNDHQRYTCIQIILSNAWGHINAEKKNKARADLAFVLPLCVKQNKISCKQCIISQVDFSEYQIQQMLWQCWVNDQNLSQKTKQENSTLLIQCGFKFEQYIKPLPKKNKSKFQTFLNSLRCKCCAKG